MFVSNEPDIQLGAVVDSEVPAAGDLSTWERRDVAYDATMAAKAGFVFGGLAIQGTERLFLSEFTRSQWVTASDGRRRRYGAGVRLFVKATSMSGKAKVGLSFLAAEAEMGNATARSDLTVVGYVGSIGDHFVMQGTFNVENYVLMRQNMDKLIVQMADDTANLRPILLEEEGDDDDGEDFDRVVGQLWALSMIADRKSCAHAKGKFPRAGSAIGVAAIEAMYGKLSAPFGGTPRPCDDQELGVGAQEYAKQQLGKLRLKT